ncbi:MAG: 3-keto-5-aminohexanoate cleavage protein [Saprospiraceae bacterium]|nr:3-keto-5-aminohexanoate cleavage protein [Saprospiraceae bacterium]
MNDLIINFTPTGMVPSKNMNPFVPIEVNEIIEEVHKANEIGITLVHLHARDADGAPTYKKSVYGPIIEGVRRHCPELVICISLSGRNFNEFEKRSEALELKPDMGSLTLSSMNFVQQASVNTPEMITKLAMKMKELGISPELEVFDLGMINYAKYLASKGLIQTPFYFNIIFGNIAGIQADLSSMGVAIQNLPENSYWSFGGLGKSQLTANSIAIASGGGVRVGLEDNLYYDKNRLKTATNIELLERVNRLAEMHERACMPPAQFGALGFYNKYR